MRKNFVLITMFALSQLFSCGSNSAVQTFVRPVKVYKVESMDKITTSYTGTLKSDEISNLAFKMGGQIVKLSVVDGQKVSKGTFIAEIDPVDQKLQEQSAKANYINSKLQLERFEKLVSKGAISQQQYESAQANFVRDQSAYENSKNMLSETKIYAPFSGIIEKKFVENYQRVQPSEPVVKLINPSNIEVVFILPESNIKYMAYAKKSFFILFEEYPTKRFSARMTKFVDSSVDGSGVPVTVVIDDPTFNSSQYLIRPGFSCTVFMEIDNIGFKGATSVPLSAIYSELKDGKDYVWLYDTKTSIVTLQPVELGSLYGKDMVIIREGLTPGNDVVTAGIHQLIEGQKVKLLE